MISRSPHMKSKHNLTFISSIFYRLSVFISLGFFILYPLAGLAEEWTYTTRPGDNLWNISKKHLKSVNYWSRLQEHNKVDVAKQLAPGTRLRVPLEWLKVQAAPAVVVSVTGSVKYIKSGTKNSSPLTSKQTVTIGDTIITEADSSVLVQFADGSTLLIQQNSQVLFDTLSSYEQTGMVDTRLRLQQGRVETSVTPMKNSRSRYEITTPAAVAAVRGTQFRIAYENQQQTMASEVVKGEVNVAAEGIEQAVKKGFGTITEKGKAPQPPVKLLTKPNINQFPTVLKYLPYTFNWPPLENANQYRVQITSAEQQDGLIYESTHNAEQFLLSELDNGQYILRLRGVDENGLEGFNAEHEFTVNTDFPVVKLLSPSNHLETNNQMLTFEWQTEKKANSYQLQIATDNEFNNLIIDEITAGNSLTVKEELQDGHYLWRITAIDKNGNKGQHSVAREFSIKESKYEGLLLLFYLIPAIIL